LKIGTEYDHEKPDSGYLVYEERLHPKTHNNIYITITLVTKLDIKFGP
jgi:hypothetical protein